MKQFITVFLTSLTFCTTAQAEINTLQKACAEAGSEKKLVAKLYQPSSANLPRQSAHQTISGIDIHGVDRIEQALELAREIGRQ